MSKYFPSKEILSSDWGQNTLWIEVTPKKIANQVVQQTTYLELSDEPVGEQYNFLAPEQFEETINNTWEPLENIMSKISQKVASTANVIKQGTQHFKVDTPLIYQNTDRRSITFLFNLSIDKNGNAKSNVTDPVKNLMKWSSPQIPSDLSPQNLMIELPYVFSVRTKKGDGEYKDIVNIRSAAITSIQPTYFHPYIGGHPCKCELTITFTDIEPVSREKTFEKKITVS